MATSHDGVYRASPALRSYERRQDLEADGVDPADISDSAQGLAQRATLVAEQLALNDARQAEAPQAVAAKIPGGDFRPLADDLSALARREARAGRISPESARAFVSSLESGSNDVRAAAAQAIARSGQEARAAGNTAPLRPMEVLMSGLTGQLRDPGNERQHARLREDARVLAEAARRDGGTTALALDALAKAD